MFGSSMIGIVVASVVFIAGVWITALFAAAIMASFFNARFTIRQTFPLAILTAISGLLAVVMVVGRHRSRQQLFALGAATTLALGLLSTALSRFPVGSGLVMLTWGLGICAAALTMACWRGGAARIGAFFVGSSCSLCVLQVIALACGAGFNLSITFGALAIMLWPLLVAMKVLEKIWSWDDAFPRIAYQCQPVSSDSQPRQVLIIAEDGLPHPAEKLS